jgi:hypothetical protein
MILQQVAGVFCQTSPLQGAYAYLASEEISDVRSRLFSAATNRRLLAGSCLFHRQLRVGRGVYEIRGDSHANGRSSQMQFRIQHLG